MSDTIFDGGPANPIGNEPGISIRDYFATAIISGMYASGAQADMEAAATAAYQQADAMLAVRSEPLPVLEEVMPVVEESVSDAPAPAPAESTPSTA